MENFGLFELLDALSALTARGEDGTGAPQDAPPAAKTAPAGAKNADGGAKNADGAPPAREGPRAHSAPAAGGRTERAPKGDDAEQTGLGAEAFAAFLSRHDALSRKVPRKKE